MINIRQFVLRAFVFVALASAAESTLAEAPSQDNIEGSWSLWTPRSIGTAIKDEAKWRIDVVNEAIFSPIFSGLKKGGSALIKKFRRGNATADVDNVAEDTSLASPKASPKKLVQKKTTSLEPTDSESNDLDSLSSETPPSPPPSPKGKVKAKESKTEKVAGKEAMHPGEEPTKQPESIANADNSEMSPSAVIAAGVAFGAFCTGASVLINHYWFKAKKPLPDDDDEPDYDTDDFEDE